MHYNEAMYIIMIMGTYSAKPAQALSAYTCFQDSRHTTHTHTHTHRVIYQDNGTEEKVYEKRFLKKI